jgi:NAD(P)-dependent dehydrogenase (short-subunit alcohol dehydrogenase family)
VVTLRIVTGGSRGIGKAIALALANEGVDVGVAARSADVLTASATELAALGGRRLVPLVVDTGHDDSVRAMVDHADAALGGVDILVNCAAEAHPAPTVSSVTHAAFQADMNVKVMGYLRCARQVAPMTIERHWGRIINVSGLFARGTG